MLDAIFLQAIFYLDVTDKITTHTYQVMYGMFLLPLIRGHRDNNKKIRLLEIGMWCDMYYGPGKSLAIWREMFKGLLSIEFYWQNVLKMGLGMNVEIWMAEYDKECVTKAKASNQLDGVHALVGDQGDKEVLKGWVQEATEGGLSVFC